jgi:hypothetical protein
MILPGFDGENSVIQANLLIEGFSMQTNIA